MVTDFHTMMNTEQFLARHGLGAGGIVADALIAEFLVEMENGLAGREGSLAMIPTHISACREIPENDPAIVIDAGGTNLRVACVSFDADHRVRTEDYNRYPMPGSETEVSAAAFFDQLAEYIRPVLNRSDRIGFCFSYPARISPELDGRLIRWTKEIKAPEVVGRFIGAGLMDALGAAGAGKKVVLLNDTVATLLAGIASGKKAYGSYVGFILGTGTNIAYLEKNKNILKVNHADPSGTQAVNVESGAFSKMPRGDIDIALDHESEVPGGNLFEKMVSGRYLPDIALAALKKGAEEGVFDASLGPRISGLRRLDHEQMDDLINCGGSGILKSAGLSDADRETIRTIMNAVIERAAKLAAVNITAAVVKAVGEGSDLSVCINIDGSTYYKASGLRENTQKYLREMLGARNIEYTLVHVERAPIVGAAIAGFVN
jgi:hexokinase